MKPEQFIRRYGVGKAREVVEGAPVQPFGYDFIDHDYFDGADIQDGYSIEQCDGCVFVPDLKRLVESLDLVKAYGSARAIESLFHVDDMGMAKIMRVDDLYWHDAKQAIRDHESIYGGGDE